MKRTKLHLFCTTPAHTGRSARTLRGRQPLWRADETCSSPYLARMRPGGICLCVDARVSKEWRRLGQLVTASMSKPGLKPTTAKSCHKLIQSAGRHEAHQGGFTDDRRQLWGCAWRSSTRSLHFRCAYGPCQILPIRGRRLLTSRKVYLGGAGRSYPAFYGSLPTCAGSPCLRTRRISRRAHRSRRIQQRRGNVTRHPIGLHEGRR